MMDFKQIQKNKQIAMLVGQTAFLPSYKIVFLFMASYPKKTKRNRVYYLLQSRVDNVL